MAHIPSDVWQLNGVSEELDLLQIDVEVDAVGNKPGREDALFSVNSSTKTILIIQIFQSNLLTVYWIRPKFHC